MVHSPVALFSRQEWVRHEMRRMQERGVEFLTQPSPDDFPQPLNGGMEVLVTDEIPGHTCGDEPIALPHVYIYDIKIPVVDRKGRVTGHLQAAERFKVYELYGARIRCYGQCYPYTEHSVNALEAFALRFRLPQFGSFRSVDDAGYYQMYEREGRIVADTQDFEGNRLHHLVHVFKGGRNTRDRIIPQVIFVPCEPVPDYDEPGRPGRSSAEIEAELERRKAQDARHGHSSSPAVESAQGSDPPPGCTTAHDGAMHMLESLRRHKSVVPPIDAEIEEEVLTLGPADPDDEHDELSLIIGDEPEDDGGLSELLSVEDTGFTLYPTVEIVEEKSDET